MTVPGAWPDSLRRHAAEELGIEDELGFDEDDMFGGAKVPWAWHVRVLHWRT